jgi:23S rRNA pseudouridine1911/1915/1917 synthase
MIQSISHSLTLPVEFQGKRLDATVSQLLNQYSRNLIKQWILEKKLLQNGKPAKPKDPVSEGDIITIEATLESQLSNPAQSLPLNIVFEDEELLVINKPAGLVVHPGAGNQDHTLLNALLHYLPSLEFLPRAGIVHRLDKETSGLMVIAKTIETHTYLIDLMQHHEVKRTYEAVIWGPCISGTTINAPMGRHPKHRIRMAVVNDGKPAITHFRLIERFREHTHVRVMLETGRTHQIRVHMAHIRHPVVGDPVYGGRFKLPPKATEELIHELRNFKRQALHAAELTLEHPITHEQLTWKAPLPQDMQNLLICLKYDTNKNAPK